MNLFELKLIIDTAIQFRGISASYDVEVRIEGEGQNQTSEVITAFRGVDWEQGKFIIKTADKLIKKESD